MVTESDTKPIIDKLWEEYERTTDPVRRAEITEACQDLAGPVGDFGLYDDDD